MNEKRETGMAWLAATILIIACILLSMCSCTSKKVITETLYVHDTVTVHHSDTIKDVVYKSKTDTVVEKEVHTYTLNNIGDTIKEIHHYHNTEKVIVVDSTNRYKSIVDSLKAVIDKNKQETKTTKSTRSPVDYLIIAVIVMAAIIIVLKSKSH